MNEEHSALMRSIDWSKAANESIETLELRSPPSERETSVIGPNWQVLVHTWKSCFIAKRRDGCGAEARLYVRENGLPFERCMVQAAYWFGDRDQGTGAKLVRITFLPTKTSEGPAALNEFEPSTVRRVLESLSASYPKATRRRTKTALRK